MQRGFARFVLGRAVQGVVFVLVVSSAALVLTRLAPGDGVSDSAPTRPSSRRSGIGSGSTGLSRRGPEVGGSGRPIGLRQLSEYSPGSTLVAERAANAMLLGGCALVLATAIGMIVGTLAGRVGVACW